MSVVIVRATRNLLLWSSAIGSVASKHHLARISSHIRGCPCLWLVISLVFLLTYTSCAWLSLLYLGWTRLSSHLTINIDGKNNLGNEQPSMQAAMHTSTGVEDKGKQWKKNGKKLKDWECDGCKDGKALARAKTQTDGREEFCLRRIRLISITRRKVNFKLSPVYHSVKLKISR